MIYLSGKIDKATIGKRKEFGPMFTFGNGNHSPEYLSKCLWAADNGCFNNPNIKVKDFLAYLEKLKPYLPTCLFAVAPDTVGNAQETWEKSKPVLPLIRKLGFPAAFVAQDGIENLPIQWESFDCLFIGGTTEFKLSDASCWLSREAKEKGKWVHWGRVNSMRRILLARFAGAHSCDGTFAAFAPNKNIKKIHEWLDFVERQPMLNL